MGRHLNPCSLKLLIFLMYLLRSFWSMREGGRTFKITDLLWNKSLRTGIQFISCMFEVGNQNWTFKSACIIDLPHLPFPVASYSASKILLLKVSGPLTAVWDTCRETAGGREKVRNVAQVEASLVLTFQWTRHGCATYLYHESPTICQDSDLIFPDLYLLHPINKITNGENGRFPKGCTLRDLRLF